ncbi:MarR family transcriptional regulator [Micromonospora sp. NPDC048835]|uniref:MarR family winged helix-turn-helix transcriptional regulator n=1 Tax=Micromonospora sp. NPDC048835 TaxID=3155147 RepID=UPI0033DA0E06
MSRESLVADLYHVERASAQAAVLFHGALAARAGITVTDISCLGVLDKDGPMPAGRLARQVGLTRGGAITAMLDRLEKAGFLRRQRDAGDRRKVTIELVRGEATSACNRPSTSSAATTSPSSTGIDEQLPGCSRSSLAVPRRSSTGTPRPCRTSGSYRRDGVRWAEQATA